MAPRNRTTSDPADAFSEEAMEEGARLRAQRNPPARGTVIEVTPREAPAAETRAPARRRATPSRSAAPRDRASSADTEALNDLSLARARLGINAFKKGGFVKAAPKTASIPVPGRQPGRPAVGVKPLGTKPMVAAAGPRTKPQAMPAMKKGGLVTGKKGVNPFAKKGK